MEETAGKTSVAYAMGNTPIKQVDKTEQVSESLPGITTNKL